MESPQDFQSSKHSGIWGLLIPDVFGLIAGAIIGYLPIGLFVRNLDLGLVTGAFIGTITGIILRAPTQSWITTLEIAGSVVITIGSICNSLFDWISFGDFCHGTDTGGHLGTPVCLNENTPILVILVNTTALIMLLGLFKILKLNRTKRLLLLICYAMYITLSSQIWIEPLVRASGS